MTKLLVLFSGVLVIQLLPIESKTSFTIVFVVLYLTWAYMTHGFVEFYKPMDTWKRPKKFVVSLTTLASRIQNTHFTISTILDNTIVPDVIYLNVEKSVQVPKELQKLETSGILYIHRVPHDLGPLTKLYPTLLEETDPETVIICVDDDMLYNKYTFEHLIKAAERYPEQCICNTGWSYIDMKYFHIPIAFNVPGIVRKVSVLQCYNGVLYRRKFFSKLDDLEQFCADCKSTDDILISKALDKLGVDIYSIPMSKKHKENDSKAGDKLGSYNLKNMQWIKCIHCPTTGNI